MLCGCQVGTGGCHSDKDGQCFACVCCECQCDLLFLPLLCVQCTSGVLCCVGPALASAGITATQVGFSATAAAASTAGLITYSAVGGLCGCCSACSYVAASCAFFALPWCTMPCYFADSAAMIDGDKAVSSWSTDCVSLSIALLCCCGWAISSTKRTELRFAFGMEEERFGCFPAAWGDECTHFWCLPCALIEERKVLVANKCSKHEPAINKYKKLMNGESLAVVENPSAVIKQPGAAAADESKAPSSSGDVLPSSV